MQPQPANALSLHGKNVDSITPSSDEILTKYKIKFTDGSNLELFEKMNLDKAKELLEDFLTIWDHSLTDDRYDKRKWTKIDRLLSAIGMRQ